MPVHVWLVLGNLTSNSLTAIMGCIFFASTTFECNFTTKKIALGFYIILT